MSPRSASHGPKHAKRAKGMSHYHWDQFQTHAFYVMPSMGPIVSVVTLIGRQNSPYKSRPVSHAWYWQHVQVVYDCSY